MLTNFMIYVKHSYDIIQRAESSAMVTLPEDLESYMVYLFANYMDKPDINSEPLCIKFMEGLSLPSDSKLTAMKSVGDECLMIDGLKLGKGRWPSKSYYVDLGQMAYVTLSSNKRPPDPLYEEIAHNFNLLSRVLSKTNYEQSQTGWF